MSFVTQQPKRRSALVGLLVVIIVLTAGVVYAIISLQQTVPSETFNGPVAALSSTCTSTATPLTITPNPATAQPGVITLTCGTNAAFTVTTAGSDTPTLTVPPITGATESVYLIASSTPCAVTAPAGVPVLVSGTSVTLALGSYNYCWTYSSIPLGGQTVGAFTISWSN